MSQISRRTATTLSCAFLAVLAATDVRADEPRVVVRVYDTGSSTPAMRAVAIRTAAAIVEEAGVAVEWHDCTEEGRRPACQNSRRIGNLLVRIMPTWVTVPGARATALAADTGHDDSNVQLGLAVIDRETGIGAMATLFHDQVLTVAKRTSVDSDELLGRALAHEIGHLLLGITGHSPTGLMRAVWTDAELTANRPEDWLFAPADQYRLHRH
jgi:hypothetical protein